MSDARARLSFLFCSVLFCSTLHCAFCSFLSFSSCSWTATTAALTTPLSCASLLLVLSTTLNQPN
ncbi:hypothetical protein GQ42DRAFT_32603 [Ramicandelaber brevisporus]|nr:hypothetical protein GQ42DRAFT_32603 [Ramicandelaber brevisporus]